MGVGVRVEGWDLELAAAVAEAADRTFAWGEFDCATWAFSVAARLTHGEPLPWAGKYDSARGASRLMKKHGLTSLAELGDRMLGDPLPRPALARRGDVCLFEGAYGVCLGAQVAFVSHTGLERVPLASMQTAWRV